MGSTFSLLPPIEYPVTREFECACFTRIVYAISLVIFALLTVINVAVVGYDPTIVLSSDFNATQSFWYHSIVRPQPGESHCDPRVFNVGESLVTNVSLFEWKILAISRPDAGKSGVAYEGGTLDSCDVIQMSFYGDIRTWSLEIVVYTACHDSDDLEVISYTTLSFSPLPGRRGLLFRRLQADTKAIVLDDLFVMATEDAGLRGWDAYLRSNRTGAVAVSVSADVEFCPPVKGFIDGAVQPCAADPPRFNLTAANMVSSNLELRQDGSHPRHPSETSPSEPFVLDDVLTPLITNILHLALAAVRIDLGNPSPNNFLTHPEALDSTLVSMFPETPFTSSLSSTLYSALDAVSSGITTDSSVGQSARRSLFDVPGSSTIQAVFVCDFKKLKSTGNLLVTVFVSTVGMFASGWAVFIFGARYVVEIRAERAKAVEKDPELAVS